jgi:glycosyltransferase involved in cell wall biosynthesis
LNPKKIIILGPAHPLRPGGMTTFNERLCRAFLETGHHCSIWSFSLQYPSFLFPGTSQFTDAPPPEGIPIRSVMNSINPFNWIKTGLQLKKEKPDLIVVRFWLPFMGACLGSILRLAKSNQHTRVICIADNVIPHEKRPGDRQLTTYFIKAVDAFVVMSEKVLTDLRKFTPKPARQMPHPLYDNFGPKLDKAVGREGLLARFGISIDQQTPLLVFFGLIRQYKGLDLLLDALALTQNKQVKLLVAGEFYEDKKPYLEQVEKNGLANRVIIQASFIEEADVKYFICAADCIIQPYRNATQSGVTPVAYHFEVPMIVTNVGGLPQMVPHGRAGLVCEPDSISIAGAIDSFFGAVAGSFSQGLLAEKEKLSWPAFTSGLLEMADTL